MLMEELKTLPETTSCDLGRRIGRNGAMPIMLRIGYDGGEVDIPVDVGGTSLETRHDQVTSYGNHTMDRLLIDETENSGERMTAADFAAMLTRGNPVKVVVYHADMSFVVSDDYKIYVDDESGEDVCVLELYDAEDA